VLHPGRGPAWSVRVITDAVLRFGRLDRSAVLLLSILPLPLLTTVPFDHCPY
jgi:hypothetical protein